MIGSQPTVGCVVFLHESTPALAIEQVFTELNTFTFVKCERRMENKWLIKLVLGGSETEGLLFALENNGQIVVFIEFDEEKSLEIANNNRQSLETIFIPYANALKQLANVIAIGIGFEMAIPAKFDDTSLEDAGIAVLFEKGKPRIGWLRRDIYRLIGHTEQPLVGAV